MYLNEAYLTYGSGTQYEVKDVETFGIPVEFDFNNAEACATRALVGMAVAGGGHVLRECRVLVNVGRHTATVSASGATLRYAPRESRKLTAAEAMAILETTEVLPLPNISPRGPVVPQSMRAPTGPRRWRA